MGCFKSQARNGVLIWLPSTSKEDVNMVSHHITHGEIGVDSPKSTDLKTLLELCLIRPFLDIANITNLLTISIYGVLELLKSHCPVQWLDLLSHASLESNSIISDMEIVSGMRMEAGHQASLSNNLLKSAR